MFAISVFAHHHKELVHIYVVDFKIQFSRKKHVQIFFAVLDFCDFNTLSFELILLFTFIVIFIDFKTFTKTITPATPYQKQ